MKRILTILAITMLICAGSLPAAAATVTWYNGDFNGANGLSNEINTIIPQSFVYDDFIVPSGQTWSVVSAWTNNLMSFFTSSATWEIRKGVSAGNPGVLVATGISVPAVQSATGRNGFGFTEYTIAVNVPNIVLPSGTYWLAVAPIDSGNNRSFISTTSGFNAIGLPAGNDDNSFFTSAFFGAFFSPASNFVGFPADFSMGILADVTSAPLPGSLLLLGSGLLGLLGFRYRKV